MAGLVECARCGRRFVESAADRVAGKIVCPACVAAAKQEAAAEAAARTAAARKRQPVSAAASPAPRPPAGDDEAPCAGCGKSIDKASLTLRDGRRYCYQCLQDRPEPGAAPAAAPALAPGAKRVEDQTARFLAAARVLAWPVQALAVLTALATLVMAVGAALSQAPAEYRFIAAFIVFGIGMGLAGFLWASAQYLLRGSELFARGMTACDKLASADKAGKE